MSDPKRVHQVVKDSHAPVRPPSRRDFVTAAAFGLAVLSGGSALLLPRSARAQKLQIEGVQVETQRLTDKLENLLKRKPKTTEGIADNGDYLHSVLFPKELKAIFVMEPAPQGEWGNSRITISFPKLDEPPTSAWTGWSKNFSDFVPLVKKLTGKEVKGLILITERTTEEGMPVINAFALPTDARGNVIGQYKGGNLALGVSFSPQDGSSGGSVLLLLDPGVSEPAQALSERKKVALK